MFRRRRREGKDGQQPGTESLPAEEELAAQDFPEDEEYPEDQDASAGDLDYDEYEESEEFEPHEAAAASDDATAGSGAAGRQDLGDPATWTRMRDTAPVSAAMERSAGPWDSASGYPEAERVDFGSLLVPVREGFDVQVFVSDEEGISIAVVQGDSGIQLQPFAAPRSAGLWDEVRPEIADEVAKAGGQSVEHQGPFGPELFARVSPQQPPGQRAVPPQPLRFLGADGPRWFLRGLISGPAADDNKLAEPLEEIFSDVVVVRGDHAEPPRKPLDIQLPEEAREILEGQLAAQEPDAPNLLDNPFERGPEITETR